MFSNYNILLYLIGLIIIETWAQYQLQKSVKVSSMKFLVKGMILYIIVAFLYYKLLGTGQKLVLANSLWNGGTAISVALIGVLVFKQKMSYKQIAGLILTIVGVEMLSV